MNRYSRQFEELALNSQSKPHSSLLALEKGLQDILDNCMHVSHLREQGLITEMILSINEFYLVPSTIYSTQKIATIYIKLMAILNQIEAKEHD